MAQVVDAVAQQRGKALMLTHSPSGSFLIRPSPVARREGAFKDGGDVRRMASTDIEKAFLEIDMLTEEKLKQLARTDDLGDVAKLELRVDTTDQSIAQLGAMLPRLEHLVLSNSIVSTFRDFGTSLRALRVLHLNSSHVKDLDGIGALEALQELFVESNYIKSLTPLAMHENLELLDLGCNDLAELSEVDQLGTCFKLQELTLRGNRIAKAPCYRRIVFQLLPQLRALDGRAAAEGDRKPVDEATFDRAAAELERLGEVLSEDQGAESDAQKASPRAQEGDASPRTPPSLDVSRHSRDWHDEPLSERQQQRQRQRHLQEHPLDDDHDMIRARPSTPRARNVPASPARVDAEAGANKASGGGADAGDSACGDFSASSDLTHGADVVFAGNLAASMRRRKRATRMESNELRLRQAADALREDIAQTPTPSEADDDSSMFAHVASDDAEMQAQLDELLRASSGLEKELHRLQKNEEVKGESPKSRLLRQRGEARRASGSEDASARRARRTASSGGNARVRSSVAGSGAGPASSTRRRVKSKGNNQADRDDLETASVGTISSIEPDTDYRCASRRSERSDEGYSGPGEEDAEPATSPVMEPAAVAAAKAKASATRVKRSGGLSRAWKPSPPAQRPDGRKTIALSAEASDGGDGMAQLAQFMSDLGGSEDMAEEEKC